MTRFLAILFTLAAVPATAQTQAAMGAEWSKERQQIVSGCGSFDVTAIGGCVYTLATDSPLHVTFGTIAPQSGVAFGPALVGHDTPGETWRINWSTDAVVAAGGSWRAGAYASFVHTSVRAPVAVFATTPPPPAAGDVYPVYSLFAQTVSLKTVTFFGPVPTSGEAGHSIWTMKQTIIGGRALAPVGTGSFGVLGGATARLIHVGGRSDGSVPAIDTLYAPDAVPGLDDDRGFLQVTGGVRWTPGFGVYVHPAYSATIDEFLTSRTAHESFTRWTVDLVHEFPFYRTVRAAPRDANTPNDCSTSPDDHECPAPSRNRYGAASVRLLTIESRAHSGDAVPFYLQPTLGGSDINGEKRLASFDDSFFRGPNLLLVQAAVEHSLFAVPLGRRFALPLGGFILLETGSVANRWGDLFTSLERSYSAGVTIRAGGFPEMFLMFAWGGGSHRYIATINPALLGGSPRPSLF